MAEAVDLWRGRTSTVALPLVDVLQCSPHERRLVVLGQAFGVVERRDALLIGQHADRPGPIRAPHATIQPERIDDPQYRLPDIVVGERLVRHRAGAADLHPYVLVLSQGEQLGKIGPNVSGDRRASRLQQTEMVDNDDLSRCRWMCGSPLSRMPQQSKFTGKPCLPAAAKARYKPGWSAFIGRPSLIRMRMPRAPGVAAHFATTSSIAGLVASTGVTTRNLSG